MDFLTFALFYAGAMLAIVYLLETKMHNSNWPDGINRSDPNHTLVTPRVSKYDGKGAWAKNSSNPPWGWKVVIPIGLIVFGLFLFGPTLAARLIGI
ncbi:MAG: hypothetical protein CML16_03190 [Pusillimonas sp.]|nr:hypothetical protein [Pusillimonas sp.]MBC43592.1 hypothetical protein [Pusillimonas sp.]HCP79407.1 hypothetical protein [Pusillimonas sp.]|tara:strand:+ start:157 stop:444 length:288 start_codon:yes stop_codon:yes gene_type:complete